MSRKFEDILNEAVAVEREEEKITPKELFQRHKDAIKDHMSYRNLQGCSWNIINSQKRLKNRNVVPKSDSAYMNPKNDYFVFNKNHSLHPISIREGNDNFGPIRRFNQLGLLSDKTWLCGGAIRSCLDGEKPNDFDIFCQDHTEYMNLVNKFSSTLLKEHFKMTFMCRSEKTIERMTREKQYHNIIDYIDNLNKSDFVPVIREQKEKAGVEVTSFKSTSVLYKDMKIQVIYIPGYHSIIDCMDDFDFYVCRFGFDGKNFYMHDRAAMSYQNKVLDIDVDAVTYPVSCLRRISKYGKYGYMMTADISTKLFEKINRKRFEKHQLVGYVD